MSSIRIWFENLAVPGEGGRLPLSALSMDDRRTHIHGGLRLEIGGCLVPYLGYFGPDDVCFNTWLEELSLAAWAFASASEARHVFDEGEQGQPAFVFERAGDRAYLSIIDSELSDGLADPDWQRVEFAPEDFLAEHAHFREAFLATLQAEAPNAVEAWMRQFGSQTPPRLS